VRLSAPSGRSLSRVLETAVNISEGRDPRVLGALSAACGRALLDRHDDADHHRSVFTLASTEPGVTEASARRLVSVAAEDLSLDEHDGVHPRLGVVDVVPFVALTPTMPDVAVAAARAFAKWFASTWQVPVFLYGDADPGGRTLPDARREAFVHRAPDEGPAAPHHRLGATAVGARAPLVAVNVELDGDDLDLARLVAREVRERDGGLEGVRALAFPLTSAGHAQVSMNLVDLRATGLERACLEVRDRLAVRGAHVRRVELVGLAPAAELARCSEAFLTWAGISREDAIEARAARADAAGPSASRAAGPGRQA